MGLLDFVKNAGAKLLGKDDEKEAETKAVDQRATFLNLTRAKRMKDLIAKLGLEVEDLSIKVDGEVATVSGKAPNQATREKVVLAVGNTDGISRVDDRIEVEESEPEAVYHTVERGDTLSKIAKQHYGNAMKYPVIFEANKPMLTDPDKIYPGQVLRIPPIEG